MRQGILLGGLVAILASAGTLSAGTVDLSGGWRASWPGSLDPYVDIVDVVVVGDIQFIQKAAEFTQGPDQFGLFPAIPITFTQIAPGAASTIVIQDEIITNSTGSDWTDFHMILTDHGEVAFDPAATLASNGGGPIGFTIDPFQQAAFSADAMRLDIWDGIVPNGTVWNPGSGISDGDLFINIDNIGDGVNTFSTFSLKETPTPEPATVVLLCLGGVALMRRQR